MFIGLKQFIWEDPAGTIVSVDNSILVSTVVFIGRQDTLVRVRRYLAMPRQ